MKMRIRKNTIVICLALSALTSQAQLVVENGSSAQQLANAITGQNVEITNPVITATGQSWGLFQANVPNFNGEKGILLCTGLLTNALGPNNTQSKSTAFVGNNGDPKLTFLSGYATRDACKLEFDIVPDGDSIRFNFTFASEEYDEYACTNFNDVFGFFISGPGIVGDPGLPGFQNIALIPGTTQPVTINDVNSGNPNQPLSCPPSNPQFHVQNPISPIAAIQYDGWTKDLVAIAAGLNPCETYHLELIIADATDRLWDSGVFIEAIESNNVRVDVVTEGGNSIMYEACNDATVSFCLETPASEDLNVTYFLNGTAINGTDYDLIDDPTPGFAHVITIPQGQLCATLDINTIDDGIGEGTEFIDIIIINPLCAPVVLDSIRTFIRDSLEVYITGDPLVCLGETVNLATDSGGTSFVWTPSDLGYVPNNTSDAVSFVPDETVLVTVTSTIAACVATDEVLVEVSNMDLDFDVTQVSCEEACNGAIDMTILNGVAPYIIAWNSGLFTTEDIDDLCPGSYDVRVIDAAGCFVEATVEVGFAPPIEIIISPLEYAGGFDISCNGAADGFIEVAIVGGEAPYDTTYSPGFSGLSAGPVTVSIVDANGCTAEETYIMLQPQPLSLVITELIPVLCTGDENGSITVSGTGGSGVYPSYIWTLNGVQVNSGPTYSNAPGGTYTVMVEDENNCMASVDVTLTEPDEELDGIIVSQSSLGCNGDNSGSVTVSGTGGTLALGSDYGYLWSDNGSTSPTRSGLAAGNYLCTISDDNGCTTVIGVTIQQPAPLAVNILVQNDIACEGQSCGNALAVASGGTPGTPSYIYIWNSVPAGSNPDFPQFSPAATFCLPGTYSLVVIDANGCQVFTSINIIIESPQLTADFDITDVQCAGDSTGAIDVTLTGGIPPFTYEWAGGNCGQGPFNTEDLNNVCAGLWCVTITDSNGCSLDTCLTIQEPPSLNYFFEMEPTLCADNCSGSIDFIPVGGTQPYNYAWFGPVIPGSGDMFDLNDTISTSEDIMNLCKGQYLIVLSDSLGCSFERTITVTAPDDLLILTDSISDYNGFQVSCPDACDGFIYVTASGGTVSPAGDYLYTWLEQSIYGPGIGFQQGMGPGFDDLTDVCASQDTVGYELILIDDNECIQNAFFIMEEPDEISFDFDVTDVSCSGFIDGEVTVTVSGGVPPYIISWTDSLGTVLGNSFTISGLGEGWYFASVVDLNGCMGMDSVQVGTPNALIVPLDFVDNNGFGEPCFGDCEGIIFSAVTGGTMPYDYSWSEVDCLNPSFSAEPAVLGGLCAGDYALTVTDAEGCFVCETITLTEPDLITADTTIVDISCEGFSDGSIDLGLMGGIPPYSIDWTVLPDGTEFQGNLGAGDYSVIVTDQNDCSQFFEFEIEEPSELIAVATSPLLSGGFNVSCNGSCDGTINLSISGGSSPYTVSWSGPSAPVNGGNQTSYSGVVCAGTYIATVTDNNGCVVTTSVTLTEATPIAFTFNVLSPISCNGECDGQLSAFASGGVGQFTYVWDDPDMTTGPVTPDNLCPGTYCVTATSGNGCVEVGCFTLVEPDVLTLDCSVQNLACAGDNSGSITCTTLGGTPVYTYEWSGPNGFTSSLESISGLAPGDYCVDVVDSRGCMYTECFTVTEPSVIEPSTVVTDYNGFGVSCFGSCDGSITVTATGGTPPYTYVPAQTLTDLCPGPYTITVTDSDGCAVDVSVTITEPEELNLELTSPLFDCGTNVNCAGGNSGSITSVLTGGTAPDATYYWIQVLTMDTFLIGEDITAIDGLVAGDYELYVVDANGCETSEFITLTEPAIPFTVSFTTTEYASGDNISCFGSCDGSITALPNGECGSVNYSWFDGTSNPVPNPVDLCADTYTLVAIDGAECTYTSEIELTQPEELVISSDIVMTACFNIDTASIQITILGGSMPFTYDWSDDLVDQEDQSNLPPGEYTLSVIDLNGCEVDESYTIVEPDTLTVSLFSPIRVFPDFNISEFMGNDGAIEATVEGGTPEYDFVWTGEDGFTAFSQDVTGLSAGQYCLVVTDSMGCVWDQCLELTEPLVLTLPNGMSPNGDGQNDGLEIQGIEAFPNNTVQVFNRWGNSVFEQNNYNNQDKWQGEGKNGNELPDGTYFVLLRVNDMNIELSGYLELRR